MSILISIEELLSGKKVEGTRMEFKEDWNPTTIMRTVCAFANDFENQGSGYVVVGVKEENGKPVRPVLGFNPDALEKVEKEMIGYSNLIQPSYMPRMSLEEIDDKHVLVIWVPAGSNRPYKVPDDVKVAKNKKYNYRIRMYSNTVIPNEEQEAELIQLTAKIPFDDRVNTHASVKDLNFGLMREHLYETKSKLYNESASMSVEELAEAMNLCQGAEEHRFPKNVGLLMFSDNPQKYFPAVQIDVVEFPEGAGAKQFEEKTFDGPIQKQLVDALSYLKTNVIKGKVIKYADREKADRIVNFPYDALEEALANAVYHRNYELREPIEVRVLPTAIEIISYNGVDPSLKQADFEKGIIRTRRYRNRRIGELLKELELTEGRGTGLPTIYSAMTNNGSPKPLFDTDEPERRHFVCELPVHPGFVDDQVNVQVNDHDNDHVNIDENIFKLVSRVLENMEVANLIKPTEKQILKYIDIAKSLTNDQVSVLTFTDSPKSNKEIQVECLGLKKHTDNFKRYIQPLLDEGLLRRTIPDVPKSRLQKYFTTESGKIVLYILNNHEE
ncbi:AlbA family DNA-binding domain-containing protein [Plebeiibacterium sediminum]|uniref:DNA binding domain-containing protein n=1 Tax=Plebeiibacterium sediminum TaxID=2992112 RepID=A0AAE3SF85_9BACT|nr:RNA-binding domain-containing protein [Plebeiobacterium sediminum]MCW3787230.1 putative DNA binding domain-containing protein [Plebeiobacterium sediminum]